MSTINLLLVMIALLGSGLMAGVFYVFSVSVMAALARIPSPEGIRAMQSINKTILNPLFLGAFVGTALVSTSLILLGILGHLGERSPWFIAASLSYLIGTFTVTAVGNVPMNEKLDTMDPETGNPYWQLYLRKWTRLNHLRTLCALAACALFAIGLI
jgi:uncharacterized membrane protein